MSEDTSVDEAARLRAEKRRREEASLKRGLILGGIVLALATLVWGALSPLDPEEMARGRVVALEYVAGGALLKAMLAAGAAFAGVYYLAARHADGMDIAKGFGVLFVVGYLGLVIGGEGRAEYDLRCADYGKAIALIRTARGSARINAETFDAMFRATGIREAFGVKVSGPEAHERIQYLHGIVADARKAYAKARNEAHAKMLFGSRDLLDQDTKALQPKVDRYWAAEDKLLDDIDAAATFMSTTPQAGYFFLVHHDYDAVAFDSKAYVFAPPADKAYQACIDKIKADAAALADLRVAMDAQDQKDVDALARRKL